MKQIKWLNSPESDSKSGIGDKAYHLSQLIRSDFSVPEAFTVTFASYRSFLEHNNLYEDLKNILASINDFSYSELEEVSHRAQEAILNGQFESRVEDKILEAYGKIGLTEEVRNAGESAVDLISGQKETQDVAVRPSTNNGLLNKILESKLNVSGKNVLLKSIKECYASLFSVPALYLLETTELDLNSIKVGIIVQRMVDADKSGTVFSKNPVSGDTSEYVVESLWGLGSALKTGESTPDIYVINKHSNELTEKFVPNKETEVVRNSYSGSTKVRRLSPQKRDGRLLDNSKLNTIISQLTKVERIFGSVKLSFAIERNKVRLLSVRELKEENEGSKELKEEGKELLAEGRGIAPGQSSGRVKQVGSPQEASREQEGILMINKCLNDFLPVINNFEGFMANKGSLSSSLAELAREIDVPAIIGVNYPLYSNEGKNNELEQAPERVVMDGTSGRIYKQERTETEVNSDRETAMTGIGNGYVTGCKLQVAGPKQLHEAEGAVLLATTGNLNGERIRQLAANYSVIWVSEEVAEEISAQRQEEDYNYRQGASDLPGYVGRSNQDTSSNSIFDHANVKRLSETSALQSGSKKVAKDVEGIIVKDFPSLMELEDYNADYILLDLESLRQSVGDERSSAVAKSISLVASTSKQQGAESAIRLKQGQDEIIDNIVAEGIDTLVVPPQQLKVIERKLAQSEKRFILSKLRAMDAEP